MAEQKDDIEVVEAKGGNNKLLIIVIGVLVLAVIGMAVMMFMGGGDDAPAEAEEAVEAAPVKQKAIFHTIDAPFIVNFNEQSAGAVRYMQVKMKMMARDQAVIDAVKANMPAIKHELLLLLYSQKYDDLKSQQTQVLQQASLDAINTILQSETTLESRLEAVYFTSFIMQ
jgi:flagellar FliL protein